MPPFKMGELLATDLIDLLPVAVYLCDAEGKIKLFNRRAVELWGREPKLNDPSERYCGSFKLYHPDGRFMAHANCPMAEALHSGQPVRNCEVVIERPDGSRIRAIVGIDPLRDRRGNVTGAVTVFEDITERKRVEQELADRIRQQTAVAEFGHYALATAALQLVMDRAVALVAQILEVEYCKVLELLPDGQALLLRAGVGWREGLVGRAIVDGGRASQAGYTLLSQEPVIVEDLQGETRFTGPPLLHDHGVVSGMSVIIGKPQSPFGILGTHTRRRRNFTSDDVQFLQAVANIIAHAIERQRAAEVVQETNEALQAVFQASPAAIVVLDRHARVTQWNPAAERMFGWSAQEVLGQFPPYVPADARDEFQQLFMQTINGQTVFEVEVTRCRKDGSPIEVILSRAPLRDFRGEVRGAVGILMDITARRRAEETLRESEGKLRAVAEAAAAAIYIHDGSKFLFVNRGGEAISGYTREELLAMDDPLQLVHPDFREAARQRTEARMRGEKVASRYDLKLLTKAGEERWLDLNASTIQYEGKTTVLVTALDVTERRRAEHLESALYRISEQSAAAEDLPHVFASLHAIVGELMCARNFYIALYDAAAGILSFPYFVDEKDVAPKPAKLGKGLTEYVLRTGEPMLASPGVFDELVRRGEVESVGPPSVDWLGVPLKSGPTTFGVLVVQSYTENVRFTEKENELLTFVGQHVATAIEHKRAQKALKQSEEKYRLLFERNLAGVYRSTLDGRLLDCNSAFARIFGYDSREQLMTRPTQDLYLHPEDREQFLALLEREGKLSGLEMQLRSKDGSPMWTLENAALVSGDAGEPPEIEGTLIDITESKWAEEELRQSEDKFRTLAETSASAIYMHDTSRFLYVNPASEVISGYTRAELLGMSPFDRVRPEFREQMRERALARLRGESFPPQVEVPIVHKNGDTRWLDLRVATVPYKGKPAILATAFDMTERKRAVEELEQSRSRYSALIQSVDGVVWEANAETFQFTFVSDKAERLLGFPKSRWLSEPDFWEKHIHPEDRGEAVAFCASCTRRKEDHTFEYRMVTADEGVVWLRDIVTYVQEPGKPALLRGILLDITSHKRAGEALRQSEQRYRSLVQGAVYGIYRSSLEDRFVDVNPALVAMLGYSSAEELLALKLSRDLYADPELWPRLIQQYQRTNRVEDVEVPWKRKDGKIIIVRLSGRAVLNQEGETEGFEMIAEDVTERQALEEELRQAQKMEAIGQLAGGLAHDFSNILTGITLFAGLMGQGLPRSGPQRRHLQELFKAAERGSSLISHLLAFSREQTVAPQVLDLSAVVREETSLLKRITPENIELVMSLGKGLGRVRIDRGQVTEILMNLVLNARDAMPKGGKLVIETDNVVLDKNYAHQHSGAVAGAYVLLSVSDTGEGMSAEVRAHVFEPFFTTKPQGQGTGLGLATVYGTVKQNGGHVDVYSEPGLGSAFKIYLPMVPVAEQEFVPAAGSGSGKPPVKASETILLVEDERLIREPVRKHLIALGYKVLSARDGEQALDLVRSYKRHIDLVLTDVVMPRIGGPELANRLKRIRPDTRVLYMSGYGGEILTNHLGPRKGTPLLKKPFTLDMLTRQIRRVLDTKGRARR